MLPLLLCVSLVIVPVEPDPSQVFINVTLAVVVESEFTASFSKNMIQTVREQIAQASQKYLHHTGLSVEFYTRPNVNYNPDLIAILSITSCDDMWDLFKNSDSRVLQLAITESDCARLPTKEAITVPLMDSGKEVSQLILDLRTTKAINWESVIVIYDDTVGPWLVRRVINVLSRQVTEHGVASASVTVYRIEELHTDYARRYNIRKILRNLPAEQLGSNFIVIVNRNLVGVIMDVAKMNGLVRPTTQWLYLIPDTGYRTGVAEFASLVGEGDNVAFVFNATPPGKAQCSTGAKCFSEELVTSFVRSVEATFQREVDLYNQVSPEEWEDIRPSRDDQKDKILNTLKDLVLNEGLCSSCINWRFQSAESWGTGGNVQLLDIGRWKPRDGPILSDHVFPHVAHGFRGRNIRITSFHYPPWQILRLNESGQGVEFKGLIFEIVNELAKNLNFSYSVFVFTENREKLTNETVAAVLTAALHSCCQLVCHDTNLPSMEKNRKAIALAFEKMTEAVRNDQVLMAAAAFTMTDERKSMVNFTLPVSIQSYTFMIARPQELSRVLLFMYPFTTDTWLCIAVGIIIMGPILNLVHHRSQYYRYKTKANSGGLLRLTNCYWYVYGALLQQGGMHLPETDSGRLVIGTWWLVVLVIVTTYCGNLVAFLTFPKIENPVNTIDDLLRKKGSISWGMLKDSRLQELLSTSREPKYQKLLAGAEFHDKEDNEMVARVSRGEHAFLEWKTNLLFLMRTQFLNTSRCSFAVGLEEILSEKIALAVAPNSPYLPMINMEIKRMHQVGLINKWTGDYWPKKDRCSNLGKAGGVKNHTVNLNDMQGSFFVLFMGFFIAVLFVIFECVQYRRNAAKEKLVIKPFIV